MTLDQVFADKRESTRSKDLFFHAEIRFIHKFTIKTSYYYVQFMEVLVYELQVTLNRTFYISHHYLSYNMNINGVIL